MMTHNINLKSKDVVSRQKYLNVFWVGFVIYTIATVISYTPSPNFVLCNVFQLIGIILFISSSIILIDLKRLNNSYLSFLLVLYFVWVVIIAYRGFDLNYDFIKILIFDPYLGLLLYLAPTFLLFKIDETSMNSIFTAIILLAVGYLFLNIYFFKILLYTDSGDLSSQSIVETFSKILGLPTGFILLTYKYHSKKRILLALIIVTIMLGLAILKARRGLTFMVGSTLISAYLLYLYDNSKNLNSVLFAIFIGFSFIVFLLYNIYDTQLGIFQSIVERIGDDSRSPVEDCFYSDMHLTEWIIGKGIDGEYFCPGVDAPDALYRKVIETDYLNIILKGGLVNLLLLLLIVLPATFMGLLMSKNLFVKGCAAWLILWTLYLYPANVVAFNLHYLLVWFAVAVCYSKKFRSYSDREMKIYLS